MDTFAEPSVFDPAEFSSFTQTLRPDSSVVDVIAPDCADAKVARKNVERKKVAVKLAIVVICRRLDMRVKTGQLKRSAKRHAYLQGLHPSTCQRIQNQSTEIIGCAGGWGNLSKGR